VTLGDPIDRGLLPDTTVVDPDGGTSIGGCDLDALARQFGTPLLVIDEEHVRARCQEWVGAIATDDVAYGSKAFLCVAMARLVEEEGLRLDVASAGELHVALTAGFPPERIVFHGNNKRHVDLRKALREGVGRIVVDSFDEIVRLQALVNEGLTCPELLVRVTPGVEAHTHQHVLTGADDSKFGFSIAAGLAERAVDEIAGDPRLRLAGLHSHIGSQILDLVPFDRAAEIVCEFAAAAQKRHGITIHTINLGGGLGIRHVGGDDAPGVDSFARRLRASFATACASTGLDPAPRLGVEPGRSIIGGAGVMLYRVGTIKQIPGVRTYVAVDGGMSDNPRPVTYGAWYETFVPARAHLPRPLAAAVAGCHCEQGDVLVQEARLPDDLHVGDLLAMPATGAYTYSMASTYNRVPRPAVVFVRDGDARLVLRRETVDDLLKLDVLAPG
jgi:diaminopimelate decarboxylase